MSSFKAEPNAASDYSAALNLADTSTSIGNGSNDRVEWSRATILDFIEDYRRQRVLWDPNTKGYHIKQTKYEALKSLGDKYGTEIRSIRSKIKSLRSSFHREHGKVINGRHKGVHYQPMWFAYEAIRFILDGETSEPTTASTNTGAENNAAEAQQQRSEIKSDVLAYGSESEETEEKLLTGITSFENADDEGSGAAVEGIVAAATAAAATAATNNNQKRSNKAAKEGGAAAESEDLKPLDVAAGAECGQDLSITATAAADLSNNNNNNNNNNTRNNNHNKHIDEPHRPHRPILKQTRRQLRQQQQLLQQQLQQQQRELNQKLVGELNNNNNNNNNTPMTALTHGSAADNNSIQNSMLQAVVGEESYSNAADNIVARLAAAAFAAAAAAAGHNTETSADNTAVIRSDDFDTDLQNYSKLISADDVKTEIIENDLANSHEQSMAMVEIPRTSTPYPINNRKRKFLTQLEDSPSPSKKAQTHFQAHNLIHSNLQQRDLLNSVNLNNSIIGNCAASTDANTSINSKLNNGAANASTSTTAGSAAAGVAADSAATAKPGSLTNTGKPNSGSGSSSTASGNATDEYGIFGEYVAITIRKLKTSKAKIVVKHLINNLLYEAEMGKYDNGIPSFKEPPQLYKMTLLAAATAAAASDPKRLSKP